MSARLRHFGRKLPIPSTLQILHDLLVFSAAEDAKRERAAAERIVAAGQTSRSTAAPVQS